LFFYVLGMTDKIGRKRGGRESVAHSSARKEKELAAQAAIPRRRKGKKGVDSYSEAELERAHDIGLEPQHVDEVEAEYEAQYVDEGEVEHMDEMGDEIQQDDVESEFEQPPPSPPPPQRKPQKRNTRMTRGRNPPPVAPPVVEAFGGGPTDLSLLPKFGKHVAAALWRGEVSLLPLNKL
jgi:hypothetical protein